MGIKGELVISENEMCNIKEVKKKNNQKKGAFLRL